ncbi:MAG: UDP-3-O-acyl-N-acetylglucosamine deacetylase [Hyphomonadaceae bacterium]
MRRQQTIATAAICEGVGVHSGAPARVRFAPGAANAGIVFVRSDFEGASARIQAHADNIFTTELGTTLRNASGCEIATVEHVLAACAGLEIDNLQVVVDGPEVPILDGSSSPFVDILLQAGVREQAAPRRRIRVRETVSVEAGGRRAALEPASEIEFDVTIRFDDPVIGVQRRVFPLTPEVFLHEIAGARTFGFLSDVDRLRAAGRGRGASLDNTLVVSEGRIVNPEGARFTDEFVRHKMLDAVGDLALAGAPILARYVADQPGHAMNAALVRKLLADPQAWAWEVETESDAQLRAAAG